MVQNKQQDDLQCQTLLALKRLEVSGSHHRGSFEALRPADLVMLEETSTFGVEWLVLRRDASRQRYLVVPTYTQPWTGCADVEITSDAPSGPLSVRCGFSGWVSAAGLESGHRSGRLSDSDLRRVLQLREQLEQGALRGSMLQHETDRSATYREWLDASTRPALQELSAGRDGSEDRDNGASEDSASDTTAPFRGPHSWLMRWGSLAATLLLTAGLAFLSGLHWHSEELQTARELTEQRVEPRPIDQDTPAISAETEQRLQHEIEFLRTEKAREIAAQQLEIDRLQNELQTQQTRRPIADPWFAILSPEEPMRGQGESIEVDSEVDSFLLLLLIDSTDDYPFYRVVIRSENDRRPIWRAEVSKRSLSEILVQVPSGLLGEGTYNCELFGLKNAQETRLHEYSFRLASSD